MLKKNVSRFLFLYSLFLLNAECYETKQVGTGSSATVSFDGCKFKIRDLQGGNFETEFGSPVVTGRYTNPTWARAVSSDLEEFAPTFFCVDRSDQDAINQMLGAKRLKGQWISVTTNAPFPKDRHVSTLIISGKNWKGIGYTYEDDLLKKGRKFRFLNVCLEQFAHKQALCLNGAVMEIDKQDSDLMKLLIPVLQSVEFTDR